MSTPSLRRCASRRTALVAALALIAAAQPLPPPVPGFPIGWCLRANPETFADATTAGFEYVELALQDALGLTEEEFQRLTERARASTAVRLQSHPRRSQARGVRC